VKSVERLLVALLLLVALSLPACSHIADPPSPTMAATSAPADGR
jgi:hypothetical protein